MSPFWLLVGGMAFLYVVRKGILQDLLKIMATPTSGVIGTSTGGEGSGANINLARMPQYGLGRD